MPGGLPFLSDDWVAALAEAGAGLPERPGATATLSTTVVGGPGGKKAETSYRTAFVDGRLVSATPGAAPDGEAELIVTQPWDDALAALRGDAGLDVAFMRGKTKVVGSVGTLAAVLPVLRSAEWRAVSEALAARTDA